MVGLRLKPLFLMIVFLAYSFCQMASAELVGVGPINPTTTFPRWYQDENDLALELCLPPGGNCLSDPIIYGNTFSQTIGFGEKAYYWSGTAQLSGSGAQGNLEMALVASFSGSTTGAIPADGEQIVFFRIALGPITGLTAGSIYRVIHPYGVIENLVTDGSGTIPRQAQDIGCSTASTTVPCDFNAVLGSIIGPFLKWDPGIGPSPPIGFIGNPSTAHAVIGSPFGTNIFRIEGPNAGGAGIGFKETNLFRVQGKIFTGTTPIPLVIDRATYTRPLPRQIEVIATSSPLASLEVSGTGITTTPMVKSGGKFFARIFNPPAIPASITVTAKESGKTPVTATRELVDLVTITLAEFNPVANTLKIEASSSDSAPAPTLTAMGFGNLVGGSGIFPGIIVPPAEVTVVSSAGGSATAPVTVIARPLARNDTGLTLRSSPIVIDVLDNDLAFGSGNSLDTTTVNVTNPPSKGTITSINPATGEVTYTPIPTSFSLPVEKDTFKYKVSDIFTQESNEATVTVTVAESEVTTITKAQFTRRTKSWEISGKSKTSSGLSGKALTGNKITIYLGPTVGGTVIGTATVNAYGNWSFSKINSPVDPDSVGATQISIQSSLGATVPPFSITFR